MKKLLHLPLGSCALTCCLPGAESNKNLSLITFGGYCFAGQRLLRCLWSPLITNA